MGTEGLADPGNRKRHSFSILSKISGISKLANYFESKIFPNEEEILKTTISDHDTISSPQEIAQKMEISPRTVEAIKDRLMERFGSKNTAGLVFFAVKNNLID